MHTQDSPAGSHATSYDAQASESKPRAFDASEAPAAPASSYSSYPDMAAGNLSHDSNKYDARIPEGIVKPKDFDSVGDYNSAASHEPTPSSGYDVSAGTNVDESDSKIPQDIMQPKYDSGRKDSESYEQKPSVSEEGKGVLAGALGYAEKPEDESRGYVAGNETTDNTVDFDKANNPSKEGNKGVLAGALGYNTEKPEDHDSARETMYESGDDYGNKGYVAANDTKDTVFDEANEGTRGYPDVPSATEAAYQAKDDVKDLNNATDDSETYTQKAANAPYVVKDKVAETLGWSDQPSSTSTGPTVTEKVKNTLGMDSNRPVSDQAKDYLGSAVDTTKDQAFRAKDAVAGYTGSATDTTKDTTGT